MLLEKSITKLMKKKYTGKKNACYSSPHPVALECKN